MKILHVISSIGPGGAQNVVYGLAKAAKAHSCDVRILSLCDSQESSVIQRVTQHDVSFLEPAFPKNFRNVKHFLVAQKALSTFVKQLKPDLIHSHLFQAKLALAVNKEAKKIPIVDTVHDNMTWWRSKGVKPRLQTLFDKYYASYVARYSVAISKSVQSDIRKFLLSDNERTPYVYNAVDEKYFSLKPINLSIRYKLILISSRIVIKKKGLDIVLDIVRELKTRYSNFRVSIIGDGEDSERFGDMLASYGLGDVITLHGYAQEPKEFYEKAHLLLMPSRWEGFGLSAVEASAMGVPVVASRVGGLAEVIIEGETGYLCESGNILEFVNAIENLITDENARKKISMRAVELARKRFSIKETFRSYYQIYERAITKN
jgi:glycosyltransferase involved in cell wall biosynthesis